MKQTKKQFLKTLFIIQDYPTIVMQMNKTVEFNHRIKAYRHNPNIVTRKL